MRERVIVECVANFSEGRNAAVVEAIAATIGREPGASVLHSTMDPDHHRSVITFAGPPRSIVKAAVSAVGKAAELIDLNFHHGQHPRLGAADVIPLVPLEGITVEGCAELAWQLGEEIWHTTGVPVYFYEAAARLPGRTRLENVRRGGFEGIRAALPTDHSRAPDIGLGTLHPTAGAVIVGARKPLIAFNVNLATSDVTVARSIARSIRTSSGGLPHVKALGLWLEARGQVQVSTNLTDFEQTPLHVVYDAICAGAKGAGVAIAGSEIIGLIPRAALERAAGAYLRCENFASSMVLENRMEAVRELESK